MRLSEYEQRQLDIESGQQMDRIAAIHRRDVCFEACADIPNPAAIPGAVEVLKEIYTGKLAGERARAHASKALRDMGVEV